MSTGLIIAIVVAAIIIIALLVMLPRIRASARRKQAERELHSRRQTVAEEHRSAAAERENRAELAEQKARMAEQAAQRERAEAGLQSERADMHERGMADHELIDESERDRFQDVANTPGDPVDRDADGHTLDDRARAATGREGETTGDYQQGREDERRFERERITDDVRDSDRTQR
jgi:FtsZ-interacting cell division protein ZipA